MIATRTLSFVRALPFFLPLVSAMVSFRLLTGGTPSPSARAARMTSFALVSRRDASAWISSFSSCGTRRRRTGLEPASTLRRRPVGVYETPSSSARIPAATSLTLEPRRAVSRTSAPFNGAGILTRMPARCVLLAAKVLAPYQRSAHRGAAGRQLILQRAIAAEERAAAQRSPAASRVGSYGVGCRALPHHVRCDTWTDHGRPVLLAVADRMGPCG